MHQSRFLILTLGIVFLQACSAETQDEKDTLFTRMPPEETGIDFVNTNREDEHKNILSYEYFYNGGGVALGDINNDGLVDIYFSANQGDNKLYLNKGGLKFEDITASAGVSAKHGWRTGVAMTDINADGYLDIYVCRSAEDHPLFRTNFLFINNKDLTFTDKAHEYGLDDDSYSTQAVFLDHDKDGDLDSFILNHSRLMISNAYDISRRYRKERIKYVGNRFLKNEDGKFRDKSDSIGIYGPASNYGLGIAYTDLNGDGWTDLYTTNDYTEKDKLLYNDKGTVFLEVSDTALTHMSQFSMGVDIADINNDGLMDMVTLDMLPEGNERQKEFFWPDRYDVYASMVKNGLHHQYMRNMLHLNNGNGTFSEIGQFAGVSNTDWSWAPLIADYDNDGWQDLFITNGFKRNFTSNDFLKYRADLSLKSEGGKNSAALNEILGRMPATRVHNYIFRNKGDLTFEDASSLWGFSAPTLSNGAAYTDLDNDGDLDLVVNNLDEAAGIYRNNAARLLKNNFLKVRLKGNDGNSFGIGARVTLYYEGGKLMKRELAPQRGFQSSVEPALFFGLGKVTSVDSLEVIWPRGEMQRLKNPDLNQQLILHQKDASLPTGSQNTGVAKLLTPSTTVIPFRHKENAFIDFKVQSLLPRSFSTAGPALAKGDVNGDGLADLYIGGAKGQASAILIQGKNGKFTEKYQAAFSLDAGGEDVDAVFFDVDNDLDQDLFVVTGGYEFDAKDPLLQDKLYKNDGTGNFIPAALPPVHSSGSCARAADIDNDGDIDLFIGARIIPAQYPVTPESHILLNDGKGSFSPATDAVAPGLKHVGLVTDALWTDINGDKQADLIVVGEWMPVKIFINDRGRLTDQTERLIKTPTEGWWNCIAAADLDHDGDIDLVAGNFGMNNQYRPSAEKPITLHYADFDNNGSIDPLISYYNRSKSYPSATRDELTDQVPVFKKKFADYAAYTTATIETILNPVQLEQSSVLQASLFETSFFRNDGNSFTVSRLPFSLQLAPIFALALTDINNDGHTDIVAGGSLSTMNARFGKAAANFTALLLGDGKGNFEVVQQWASGLDIRYDVRKITTLGPDKIIFAINNHAPRMYEVKLAQIFQPVAKNSP